MDHSPGDGLPLSAMTWAALLARWTEFARASVAFPKDDRGERWRASVAPVIGLQATTFALGDIDALSPGERALGLDRAGVLVRAHAGDLHRVWAGEAMPDALREVVDDAASALSLARSRGVEYRVTIDRLDAPDLLGSLERAMAHGQRVEFAMLPAPGVPLLRGGVAAFVRPGVEGLVVEGCEAVASPPRQVYRRDGEDAHDLIALFEGEVHPGLPLLRVVIDEGAVVSRFDDADAARASAMRASMGGRAWRVETHDPE
ncbi:MAG: hypothetical protein KF684_03095 [Phycisphaeraceae bacterium]|nr:hypothetical protein [Phycisphaeraceae bacterium]